MKNILVAGRTDYIGAEIVNQLHVVGIINVVVLDSVTELIYGADWSDS